MLSFSLKVILFNALSMICHWHIIISLLNCSWRYFHLRPLLEQLIRSWNKQQKSLVQTTSRFLASFIQVSLTFFRCLWSESEIWSECWIWKISQKGMKISSQFPPNFLLFPSYYATERKRWRAPQT